MRDRFRTKKSLENELRRLRVRLAELEGGPVDSGSDIHGEALEKGPSLFTENIVNSLPGVFFLLDENLNLRLWNRYLEHVTGHNRGRLSHMNPLDLIAGRDRPLFSDRLEQLEQEGKTAAEAHLLTSSGDEIPYHFSAYRFRDYGTTYFPVTGLDISEHERVDSAFKHALDDAQMRRLEASALLAAARSVLEYRDFDQAARSIFEICKNVTGASSGYVAVLSPDGKENELLFLDTGNMPCDVDESLPMPIRGLRSVVYQTGRAAYENDFASSKWMRYMPEGHAALDNVLFAPLIIRDKTIGLLGIANKPGGFTEDDASLATAFGELAAVALLNDRTYESLKKTEERYRSLTQSANDAIISADSDGSITSWNHGAELMFGYSEQEALGQPLTMLMPEEFRERHERGMARYLSTKEPRIIGRTVDMSGRKKNGTIFPIELSLSSWSTREGSIFFTGIVRDISSRKKMQENELNARAQVQSYANRLSILHDIGLSLNRETDQPRLLKSVLEAAAEITSSGTGVMTLTREGKTEIISVYYAPWYEQKCEIGDEIPTLHRRIARLIGEGDDATRISDMNTLTGFPRGHLELRGLLIGTLRDTKGRNRGHFMLSNKADGASYTKEDEEIIALLAAQSSVALVSAETFEHEHVVAEALQEALMPDLPLRDDIEIGSQYQSSAPFGKVGGDFYDFVELDGDRVAVFIGDVCGKGLAAATYTAMIKYMLRAYLGEGYSPAECLTRLNTAVVKQVPMEKFVTLGLSIIDTAAATLTHAAAGHPAPVICRQGNANSLDMLQAVPLGVIGDQQYKEVSESIGGVCSLALFTDGLLDARPADGSPFGEKRLLETLGRGCCGPPQQVAKMLVDAVKEYSGDNLRDDIALVVIRLEKSASEM